MHDILKPPAILCRTLQYDEICVVSAIESTLKSARQSESLKSTSFEDLATVRKVPSPVQHNGENACQGVTLTNFEQA